MRQKQTRNKKNAKRSNQMKNTDITIQMFTPRIMVFSLFFNVTIPSLISDEEELIKKLLTSRRLVRISPTRSKIAEVALWWKESSKSNTSLFHSMMFEDNLGEDGLSAQSSYIINISDSNYIENLAPDPDMFDNEIVLEHDILQKVYTKLIEALNEVRIKKYRFNPIYIVEWKITQHLYWSSES